MLITSIHPTWPSLTNVNTISTIHSPEKPSSDQPGSSSYTNNDNSNNKTHKMIYCDCQAKQNREKERKKVRFCLKQSREEEEKKQRVEDIKKSEWSSCSTTNNFVVNIYAMKRLEFHICSFRSFRCFDRNQSITNSIR